MWMLIVVWRVLVKVLRHLGWGIFLVPVAGVGILLFGVTLWTVGAALLAGALAIQWPTVAARVLPPAMVGAGLSGLVVAGRTPGSPVSWLESRIQSSFSIRAVPGKALPPARWYTYVTGGPPRLQVTWLPPGQFLPAVAKKIAAAKRRVLGGPPPGGKGGAQATIHQKLAPNWVSIRPGSGQGSISFQKGIAVPRAAFVKGPPGGPLFFGKGPSGPPPAFSVDLKGAGITQDGMTKLGHVIAQPSWPVPGLWHGRLLVPLALLLLTLGLWLTPRSLAGLRGRGATLAPDVRRWLRENRWGVLLVPVTLLGLTVFGVRPWTIAAVIAAVVVLARWPRIAADLVPLVLAIFAVRGFELAANWQSMAAAFQGPAFGRPPAPSPVMFGAVDVNTPATALLAGVEASVFLAFGAWLVPRTIGAHARTVFTPGTDVELAGRVQRLTESRSHAVDAATSELRRIERDLHDGAQARLVALGMNLRAVERVLPANPQAALALVAEARETSLRALNELRDLIRGIYPPVLADRGLGHAIRALALDTPMPTELDIDLPGRLSAPVESACYFAVAEALANAVKHSGARRVQIRIKHAADALRIEVADDGVGGADPARGTGLQGVERRLGTFDGILAVSSPPGGPTMIVMEVPCVLSSPKTSSC
jgi:signal transduction histidine kinase